MGPYVCEMAAFGGISHPFDPISLLFPTHLTYLSYRNSSRHPHALAGAPRMAYLQWYSLDPQRFAKVPHITAHMGQYTAKYGQNGPN